MIAEVYINRGAKKLNKTFDYNIPEELEDLIFVGSKVIVPFGKGESIVEAFVVKIKEETYTQFELKNIVKIEENLNDIYIELSRWMAKKYFTNVSDCIRLMLAPGVRNKNTEKRIDSKTINVIYLKKEIEEIEFDINSEKIKSKKQQKVLNFLKDNEGVTISDIENILDCSRSIVNTLIKNGYIEMVEQKVDRNPLFHRDVIENKKLVMNIEQQSALNNINESVEKQIYKKYLLHGITGSGKTEIYLQLIENILQLGKTAIMLVPEISLTPQILDRFIGRFGKEKIAILHSKLSIGERHDQWEKIRNGEIDIVIGARSAIFAPLENLGTIIIDEEHDNSYVSDSNPRYDAKEVAEYIAKKVKIPLVLGSATPDVKMYYQTENFSGTELLELTRRANNASLPKFEIIDLKQELASGNRSMLSRELYSSIEENLKKKKQTILFLNRRGYSTFIMCRDCGHTLMCKNCNISMTYHNNSKKLKCHYCGREEINPKLCPECNSDKIRYFGTGTQKLEEEIKKQFPTATTIRMDIDTVTKKNSHEEILKSFETENIDILIGTQMVTKGHHFPNVTLVGVIAADSSLQVDDYRSTERTYQLLTQVAGRAGREKEQGKVIIQTYNPENYSIQTAKEQNYQKFYEIELELRKQLKYPPFCDIIVISLSDINEQRIRIQSQEIYEYLVKNLNKEQFNVLRPMPSPIDKIQNKYRWRIIIKGRMTEEANTILNNYYNEIYQKNKMQTQIYITVNPNNMM